ncbi:MAG: hypothetical protein ABI645_11840 [Pseudomonadota bacterium]
MKPVILFVALLFASIESFAADDFKLSQVELDVRNLQQDLRNLQQELRSQAQKLDELRRQLMPAAGAPVRQPAPSGLKTNPDIWLDVVKWQRLQLGMHEMEVIGLLGPPTSMRAADQERVLLYAIEIGSSGFLSGSVSLRDHVVLRIERPVLH